MGSNGRPGPSGLPGLPGICEICGQGYILVYEYIYIHLYYECAAVQHPVQVSHEEISPMINIIFAVVICFCVIVPNYATLLLSNVML